MFGQAPWLLTVPATVIICRERPKRTKSDSLECFLFKMEDAQNQIEELSRSSTTTTNRNVSFEMSSTTDYVAIDMSTIYTDVVGGPPKKKRVRRVKSSSSLKSEATSQCNSEAFNKKVQEMEEMLRTECMEYQTQLKEEMESRLKQQIKEYSDRIKASVEANVESMLSPLIRDFKPPPTSK